MTLRGRWTRLVCGANGTGISCMLSIDREDANTGSFNTSQIIFVNCGDSTQQACLQSHIKLQKLSHIVFTSVTVHNICGLPGIVLSLSDLGVEKLQLVGPPGLKGFIDAMGVIVKRRYPEILVREVEENGTVALHEQLIMNVTAIRSIDDNGTAQSAIGVGYIIPGLNFTVWPIDCSLKLSPSLVDQTQDNQISHGIVIFIPLSISALIFSRRQMVDYLDDTLEGIAVGATILLDSLWSDDVVEFPRSQQTTLLAHRLFPRLFPRAFPLVEAAVECAQSDVIPLQPDTVLGDSEQDIDNQLWRCLSSESEINVVEAHLSMIECLLSPSSSTTSSERAANSVAAKHLISLRSEVVVPESTKFMTPAIEPITNTNQIAAAQLREQLTKTPITLTSATITSIIAESTSSSSLSVSPMVNIPPPTPFDLDITFLGTGSAVPSKLRANSAILIKFPRSNNNTTNIFVDDDAFSMLLDAGEGVSRQLFHSVSGNKARFAAALLSIGIIWISHHHADHLCGLPQLIENIYRARWQQIRACARRKRNADSLSSENNNYKMPKQYTDINDWPCVIVYASVSSITYIEYALNVSGLDDIVDIQPMTNTVFAGATFPVYNRSHGQIQRLRSVAVYHCRESYGLVLDLWNGFKIVYSGDCRPSEALKGAGSDCDLLIHEATFADNCADHAVIKKHCTVSEALAVASSMRVKQLTILTHFSQRYAIRPLITPEPAPTTLADSAAMSTMFSPTKVPFAVAFDFLHFSFPSHCAVLPEATASLGDALERINSYLQQQQQQQLLLDN